MALKDLALAVTRGTGLQALTRWRCRDRLTVLCYHGVVADDHRRDRYQYRNTVGAGEFAAHLEALRSRFVLVTADQVLAWLDGTATLPRRALLITFDDGYRNNLTVAAPILARFRAPALVSVSTDYIGSDRMLWPMELDLRLRHWSRPSVPLPDGTAVPRPDDVAARDDLAVRVRATCKRLPDAERRRYVELVAAEPLPDAARADRDLWAFLDWDEVRQLRDRSVAIASHTCSHPILSRLPADDLQRELAASKARIEREVGPCPVFVYPNGGAEDVSPQVLAAVAAAGYRAAFSLMDGINPRRPDRYCVDRIGIPGHVGLEPFHFRASGLRSVVAGIRRA